MVLSISGAPLGRSPTSGSSPPSRRRCRPPALAPPNAILTIPPAPSGPSQAPGPVAGRPTLQSPLRVLRREATFFSIRSGTALLGFALLGFTGWLLAGLAGMLRHGLSTMLVPHAGPGPFVALVGAALITIGPALVRRPRRPTAITAAG
jgi:hypothetical protein